MKGKSQPSEKSKSRMQIILAIIIILIIICAVTFIVMYHLFLDPFRGCDNTVVIASDSMSHSDLGVEPGIIDLGDTVCYDPVPDKNDVVTYIEGRASSYSKFGDFGDVLIFYKYGAEELNPLVHRVMAYLIWNSTYDSFDIPALGNLQLNVDWSGKNSDGSNVTSPYNLTGSVIIYNVGYLNRNFTIYISDFIIIGKSYDATVFYLTAADHNIGRGYTQPDPWIVKQEWIQGKITKLIDA